MIVLALVLLLIVAVAVAGVLLSSPTVHDFSVFRALIPVTDAGMFLAGAAVTLLAVIAIILLRTGIRRSRARRKQVKAIRSGAARQSPPVATTRVPAATSTGSTSSSAKRPDPPATADPAPSSGRAADDQPSTDSAERARLLAEADAVTRDDPPR
jgi:hypothetical protein